MTLTTNKRRKTKSYDMLLEVVIGYHLETKN